MTLLKVSGDGSLEVIEETVSDVYGYYRFRDLRPGAYVIRIGVAEGDVLTYVFGAPLGEIDSDFDPETAQTDVRCACAVDVKGYMSHAAQVQLVESRECAFVGAETGGVNALAVVHYAIEMFDSASHARGGGA